MKKYKNYFKMTHSILWYCVIAHVTSMLFEDICFVLIQYMYIVCESVKNACHSSTRLRNEIVELYAKGCCSTAKMVKTEIFKLYV